MHTIGVRTVRRKDAQLNQRNHVVLVHHPLTFLLLLFLRQRRQADVLQQDSAWAGLKADHARIEAELQAQRVGGAERRHTSFLSSFHRLQLCAAYLSVILGTGL